MEGLAVARLRPSILNERSVAEPLQLCFQRHHYRWHAAILRETRGTVQENFRKIFSRISTQRRTNECRTLAALRRCNADFEHALRQSCAPTAVLSRASAVRNKSNGAAARSKRTTRSASARRTPLALRRVMRHRALNCSALTTGQLARWRYIGASASFAAPADCAHRLRPSPQVRCDRGAGTQIRFMRDASTATTRECRAG